MNENEINNAEYIKDLEEKIKKLQRENAIQKETINKTIGTDLAHNNEFAASQPGVQDTASVKEQQIEEKEKDISKDTREQEQLTVAENFKELDREQQIALLKEYMEAIQDRLREEYRDEIASGNFEVRDLSYNELADGSIILDAEIMRDGEITHEQFNKNLDRIDIEKDIETLRSNGKLTPELEEEMMARKQELEGVKDNPEKISLNELEVEKTLEDDEKYKQIEEEAKNMGIDKEEINPKNLELDKNGDPKFKASSLEQMGKVTYIDGNVMLSEKDTFNSIMDLHCQQYALYMSGGKAELVGIENDKLIDISDSLIRESGQKNVSFMKPTRDTMEAGSVASFRVRRGGEELNGKYSMGFAMVNGDIKPYVAVQGSEYNQPMAMEFPTEHMYTVDYYNRGKSIMSKYVSDQERNDQSEHLDEATKDNTDARTDDMLALEENIDRTAEERNIDKDELHQNAMQRIEKGEDNNRPAQEVVLNAADEITNEKENGQAKKIDHGERDFAKEYEEAQQRKAYGNYWNQMNGGN